MLPKEISISFLADSVVDLREPGLFELANQPMTCKFVILSRLREDY
jgi:hypothetical protein